MTAQEPFDIKRVGAHYGGGWCDCIESVLDKITAKKLAVYCVNKGYKPFPEPVEDDLGIGYSYLMTVEQRVIQHTQNEQEVRAVNRTATFGQFNHRGLETLQSLIGAVKSIAEFEGRSAQSVAEDVIKADESKAPEVRVTKTEQKDTVYVPKQGRYIQDREGNLRSSSI